MGANNCKSADDMQPLFDDVFEFSYALLGLDIINTFFYWLFPLNIMVGMSYFVT